MGKPLEQLGRLLKPPPEKIGVVTGEVISTAPLKVRINDAVIAKYPRLFYAEGLSFKTGNMVIVIVSSDNQRFYIIGKAVSA